jgi:hypothetical protein
MMGDRMVGLTVRDDSKTLFLREAKKIDSGLSEERFLEELVEKHGENASLVSGTCGMLRPLRVATFEDIYNKAYVVTNDIGVYLYDLKTVVELISTKWSEGELIKQLCNKEFVDIHPLYAYNLVETPWDWGPVVMHSVRKYIVKEDRYYIDSSPERDKCVKLLNGPMVDCGMMVKFEKTNYHYPIPRYCVDIKMTKVKRFDRKVSLHDKFREIYPSFSSIYKTFEKSARASVAPLSISYCNVRIIEKKNIPGENVMYVLDNGIKWETFKNADFPGMGGRTIYLNTDIEGDMFKSRGFALIKESTDFVFVCRSKKKMNTLRHSVHPLVKEITRAQGVVMFVAQLYHTTTGEHHNVFTQRPEFLKSRNFWITYIPFQ